MDAPVLDLAVPAWVCEITLTLSITSQFIVAGNIRDVHLIRGLGAASVRVLTTARVIVDLLIDRHYDLVYSYDPADGIVLEHHGPGVEPDAFFSSQHLGRATSSTTGRLADLVKNARTPGAPRVAVVVAYALRLWAEEPHAGPTDLPEINSQLLRFSSAVDNAAKSTAARTIAVHDVAPAEPETGPSVGMN